MNPEKTCPLCGGQLKQFRIEVITGQIGRNLTGRGLILTTKLLHTFLCPSFKCAKCKMTISAKLLAEMSLGGVPSS